MPGIIIPCLPDNVKVYFSQMGNDFSKKVQLIGDAMEYGMISRWQEIYLYFVYFMFTNKMARLQYNGIR